MPGFHVFNLATGRGTSVLQFISAFEKVSGVKIQTNIIERREGQPDKCLAVANKANKYLNWRVKYSVQDALKDTWRWAK